MATACTLVIGLQIKFVGSKEHFHFQGVVFCVHFLRFDLSWYCGVVNQREEVGEPNTSNKTGEAQLI